MDNVIAITARSAVSSEPKKLIRLLFSLQLILFSLYGRKVGAEEQVALNGDRFKVFEVDLTSNDLSLHWRRPDGLPFLNLVIGSRRDRKKWRGSSFFNKRAHI